MKNINKKIKIIASILLGSLIYAIAINAFIAPHKLLSGGVAGISLLLEYVSNIPSGLWVFVVNVPIFIVGYKLVNREFIVHSFIGMISMSTFLLLTKNVVNFIRVEDMFIAALFGGVLSGFGMGIIFKVGASQGGTDIIAVIIRKKNGAKISTLYMILNAIIVGFGVFVTNITLAAYTLVSMYVKSQVIDGVINSFNKKRVLMIITSKEEEVSKAIMDKIGRGITYLYGEGAYTGAKRKVLYCIVVENQLNKARAIIEEIDNKAIISISEALDVQGKGFLKPAL